MAEAEPRTHSHHVPPDPAAVKMTQLAADQDEKHRPPSAGYGYGYGSFAAVRDPRRAWCSAIVVLLILAGIAALTVWLLYRPYKPKFRVVGATVYQLNTTSPPFITTTMQFTVVTRNPNERVSLYYDNLSAYVAYKNQPITAPVILPPLVHETKTTVALSPVLGGSAVPVAAEAANGLQMDVNYGVVGLRLVLTGKLRYKAGAIWSRRNEVNVRCTLYVGLKKGFVGQLPLLAAPPCAVDV